MNLLVQVFEHTRGSQPTGFLLHLQNKGAVYFCVYILTYKTEKIEIKDENINLQDSKLKMLV